MVLPSLSSMPLPPYNYYACSCVIKSETSSSDAEMEEGEQSFNRMDPVLTLVVEFMTFISKAILNL